MRNSLAGLVALTLAGACATGPASGTTSATTAAPANLAAAPAAEARCAAVADSARAATPVAELPLAVPRARPRIPIPGRGVAGEIETTFLVDPAGRAVRGSIVTTGGDHAYQRSMEDVVLRTLFRPPVVAGCPAWGRGSIQLRSTPGTTRIGT